MNCEGVERRPRNQHDRCVPKNNDEDFTIGRPRGLVEVGEFDRAVTGGENDDPSHIEIFKF